MITIDKVIEQNAGRRTAPGSSNGQMNFAGEQTWFQRNKKIILIGAGITVLIVGFYIYKNYFSGKPKSAVVPGPAPVPVIQPPPTNVVPAPVPVTA